LSELKEMEGFKLEDFSALFAYFPVTAHPKFSQWKPTREYREDSFVELEKLMKGEPTLRKVIEGIPSHVEKGRLDELLVYGMECAKANGANEVKNPLLNISLPLEREQKTLAEDIGMKRKSPSPGEIRPSKRLKKAGKKDIKEKKSQRRTEDQTYLKGAPSSRLKSYSSSGRSKPSVIEKG